MNPVLKKSWPFRIHLSTLMISVLLISCIGLSFFIYDANRQLVEQHTSKLLKYIIKQITQEVEQSIEVPEQVTNIISRQHSSSSLARATTIKRRMQTLPFFTEILQQTDKFLSIYAGYNNGQFFQLKKYLPGMIINENFNQPLENLKWIVRSIDQDDRKTQQLSTFYLDADLNILFTFKADSDYDPRKRAWYINALQSPEIQRTDIINFASDKKLGFIISRQTKSDKTQVPYSVIGTSVYLSTLSETLKKQQFTPNSEIVIVDQQGRLVAYKDINKIITQKNHQFKQGQLSDLATPELNSIYTQWQSGEYNNNNSFDVNVNNTPWRMTIVKLKIQPGTPLNIIIAIPHNELYKQARLIRDKALSITAIFLLIFFPLTLYLASRISKPLKLLADETHSIRNFDFSEHKIELSYISEIDHLNDSMSDMKSTIRRFLDINMIIASEDNFDRLLPRLLKETLSVAKAESIALYLADQDNRLYLAEVQNNSGNISLDKKTLTLSNYPDIVSKAIQNKEPVVAKISTEDLKKHGLDILISNLNYKKQDYKNQEHTKNIDLNNTIAIPLFNRKQELVGVMLLITRETIDQSVLEFITALCSSSAITLETRTLIQAQKDLFEAFVKLIAGAIDAKSPYTGGHCARVPVLTKMLAKAADDSNESSFNDFKIVESEWEAIHIAAWLHDCGKVTTPEYVVDKATKLETIYDRIHEIRMRFEVLYRDAQLKYYQAVSQLHTPSQINKLNQQLEQELTQLQKDFAFIAQCNEGEEFMSDEDIERLKTLSQVTWKRHFSDREGISEDEKLRKIATPEAELPATEYLLADKPEHLFSREDSAVTKENNPWGFKMKVPELLYNRGELYNLSVKKGTLSEEERFKINEHIIQTIIMLSQLPFPRHLKQVTEIAGGHHEKVDGSGYPRGLTAEQMSPVARMMAVADIFEALTAVDRPYKKGKTLSQALRIMSFMVKDQHIDAQLFKLFLTSGIYLQYAKEYLKPEQIDTVDIAEYL